MLALGLLLFQLLLQPLSLQAVELSYGGSVRYRYTARVMYDGGRYKGWQDQDGKYRTIQGTIGVRLSQRFDAKVSATGASRTDQGVHARGQAIHFDAPTLITDTENLQFVLNRMLPDDIKLCNLTHSPPGTPEQILRNDPWHATKSATGKLYIYRFSTNKVVDPMIRRYCSHFFLPLDMEIFQDCLSIFVGTHNFRAFTNRVEMTTRDYAEKNIGFSTVKTVHSIDLVDEGDGCYRIEFRIKSATYRMIRNIIGAAAAVATGKMTRSLLESFLLTDNPPSRNDNKSLSAPPEGLCLEHVFYDNY